MIKAVSSSALPALTIEEGTVFSDRVQVKEFFAKAVKEWKGTEFSLDLSSLVEQTGLDMVRDAVEGMLLAAYETEHFPPAEKKERTMELTGLPKEGEAIIERAENLAEAVCWARNMVNRPGNLLRPGDFAEQAKALVSGLPVEVEVLDEEEMQKIGLNAVLAVGMSSAFKPRLCILRYRGGKPDAKNIGLVGKGVTCDTGGYCVKPGDSMKGIKGDMAGGAAVIGAVYALAKNHVEANVTALVPMVENRISDSAMLPGDVLTAYGGKTIEMLNSDAEGRLILADAVAYAVKDEQVDCIVDIATLTGSVCRSLGFGAAGALSNNDEFYGDFVKAYEASGERYLRFPIYPEYERMNESKIADIRNIGGDVAGSITAGLFIRAFTEDKPWIHLDIAGTAWVDKPVFEYQTEGATGAGLTTLYQLCKLG